MVGWTGKLNLESADKKNQNHPTKYVYTDIRIPGASYTLGTYSRRYIYIYNMLPHMCGKKNFDRFYSQLNSLGTNLKINVCLPSKVYRIFYFFFTIFFIIILQFVTRLLEHIPYYTL